MPYSSLHAISEEILKETDDPTNTDAILARKSKLALWLSGNCAHTKGRFTLFFDR